MDQQYLSKDGRCRQWTKSSLVPTECNNFVIATTAAIHSTTVIMTAVLSSALEECLLNCDKENMPTFSKGSQPPLKSRIFGSHHLAKLQLDISAHLCPKRFIKELQYVFPNCDLTDVIAIPTMQFAKSELVNIGDEIEVEKDRLLERVSCVSLFSSAQRNLCWRSFFKCNTINCNYIVSQAH